MTYLPEVAWTTLIQNVIMLTPTTYRVTVVPIDPNEPGGELGDKEIGYYLKDNVGHTYSITEINVDGSWDNIEITDDFNTGYGPQTDQYAYVYKSVGEGEAPYLAPIRHERLDNSSLDYSRAIELDVIWKNKAEKLSTGIVIPPTFTDHNDGTITVGNDGIYNLHKTADGNSLIKSYPITGNLFTLTNLVTNYIVADYNNGNPLLRVVTDVTVINETTIVPVLTIYRGGTRLHILTWDTLGVSLANKLHQSIVKTQRYRVQSGLRLSESGTRNVNVSEGIVWVGANSFHLDAFNSASNQLFFLYKSGGVWQPPTIVTQYNNSQYDDGDLHSLNPNKYAVNFIYRGIEVETECYMVLGGGNYTLLEAQGSLPPLPATLPPIITSHALLVGRIIVEQREDIAYQIDSIFSEAFALSTTINHADLNNLTWVNSGHIGEVNKVAGFSSTGVATYITDISSYPIDVNTYGFLNQSETTIAFDPNTYIFTLGSVGASWSYYRAGLKWTITGGKSVRLTTTGIPPTGIYYIFIDATDGTLSVSNSAWTLNDTKVPVVIIYFNDSLTPKYVMSEERHTCTWPRALHRYEHLTNGTRLITRATLTGYTLNSDVNANKTFAISNSVIADEDIFQLLASITDPDGITNSYWNMYKTSGEWVWESSNMPFRYTAAGYIQYDNAGTMTQGQNNKFYNTYLFLSNIQGNLRHVFLSGKAEFSTENAAYAEEFATFNLAGLPMAEGVAIYQITWNTSASHSGSGKCVLNRVKGIQSNVVNTTQVAVTSHNTLAGLQGGTVNEYYHLTNTELVGLLGHKTTEDALNGLVKVNGAGVYSAVTDNSANWNTAFGWGNHAGLYSLLGHNHTGLYDNYQSWTFQPENNAGSGTSCVITSGVQVRLKAGTGMDLTTDISTPGVVLTTLTASAGTNYWNRTGIVLSPATANDRMSIISNASTSEVVYIENTLSSGTGLYVKSNETAIKGESAGVGVYGISFSSSGVMGSSTLGYGGHFVGLGSATAGLFEKTTSSQNTQKDTIELLAKPSSGAGQAGIGTGIIHSVKNASELYSTIARHGAITTVVTNGAEDAFYRWQLIKAGAITTVMQLSSTGIPYFNSRTARVTGSDAATANTTLTDITGLSIALRANETYMFEANLFVGTSAVTTGTKYGVQFNGAGASVQFGLMGSSTSTAMKAERGTALNTASGTYLATSGQTGVIKINGIITVGANSGNLTIQHLKVTSGTSTVYISSHLKVERI